MTLCSAYPGGTLLESTKHVPVWVVTY